MGKTACKTPLLPGSELKIGGKEVEIDSVISKEDFMAGKPFLGGEPPEKAKSMPSFVQPKKRPLSNISSSSQDNVMLPPSQPLGTKFKPHAVQQTSSEFKRPDQAPVPRHDPKTPGALVMPRPKSVPKGKQIVDVVMDPFLGRHLRPHQREGVQFMYECVMGMKESGEGCLLADEMGLGKTLQTIALLWMLLKQNPIYGAEPVVKRAMIVCPVGLCNNWRKEFRKWLGLDRIGVKVLDNDKNARLKDFTLGSQYPILVIGYEKLRTVQEELKNGAPIDIIICDEGHKMKAATNKSAEAIRSLSTEKRVVLSGTPLQNDLKEFFNMVDFVNPGLLGKYNTFKREFETPILQSRVPNATSRNLEKGTARSEELVRLTAQFIIRRTSDVIAQFLPPKNEIVLFIQPTQAQATLYRAVLESPVFGAVLGQAEAYLQLINYLKKLCNSPRLLSHKMSDESTSNRNVANLLSSIAPETVLNAGKGAKLQVLEALLHEIKTTTDEKVVLVSNYTSTLDMLGSLLASVDLPFLRLDGSTPVAKRQGLVDRFNNSNARNQFAFLLSAKAGGVGINLIGASRLILFDVDWNPATDLQAMARIHRDGQKKPCFIYRMLIKGAMDEKIFQRQVTKTGLADAVVDAKKTGQHFTHDELRDLFRLDEGEACQSAPYLENGGFLPVIGDEKEDIVCDGPLSTCLKEGTGQISYVFAKSTG